MSLEILLNNIIEYPSNANDNKIICILLDAEYKEHLSLIKIMEMTSKSYKFDIQVAFDNFNDSTYLNITNKLLELETIKEDIKHITPQTQINADIIRNIKSIETCSKFFSLIPPSFINTIIETEFYLKETFNNLVNLPIDIITKNTKTLNNLRLEILNEIMKNDYIYINPFLQYETYIISNNIIEYIEKLSGIENCLLNSELCAFNRHNYINQETNLLWSDYYKEIFLLNSNYRLDLSKITTNETFISQFNEILTRIKRFIDNY